MDNCTSAPHPSVLSNALLSKPPTVPHYVPIYALEAPVPASYYRSVLPPKHPSMRPTMHEHGDAGPYVPPSMPHFVPE